MTIKFVHSRVLIKLEEIHRKLAILPLHRESRALGPQQYCPYTENRGPWVLSVQVGDKGLKLPLEGSDGG